MGPAYGGDGGGNSWVVHAHNRPRRGSRCSAISVDAQRGHESCEGNVTIPHAEHRPPISRGSSPGHVKRPSATGTRAIACPPSRSRARSTTQPVAAKSKSVHVGAPA